MQKRWLKNTLAYYSPALPALSAPGALDYVFHFPDEKYYTDAVLHMIDKDECLPHIKQTALRVF